MAARIPSLFGRARALRGMAVVLVACSSTETAPGGSEDFDAGGPDANSDATTMPAIDGGAAADQGLPDEGPDGPCPRGVPTAGADCDAAGLWCEFGGGAHERCSVRALCAKRSGTAGLIAWNVFPAEPGCGPNAPQCPPSYGESPDASCPVTSGTCDYVEGRCACVECVRDAGPGVAWFCRAWSAVGAFFEDGGPAGVSGCPADRPRLGTECDAAFLCGYDACYGVSLGPYLACRAGRWGVGPQTDLCNAPDCR